MVVFNLETMTLIVRQHIQFLRKHSNRFVCGYQSKYFGWPAMYTANKFIDPIEYENIKTRLFILNHQHNFGGDDESSSL